jgi:hypothetical protein
MTTTTTDTAPIGHNNPPADKVSAFATIADLYDEAKNWADGEPITSVEIHDKITELREKLHEAGKVADELRKEEKKPHDDAIKEIQDEFNPYVQPKKGKVDRGKAALDDLLGVWRQRVAAEKAAVAAKLAEEAAEAKRKADAAMQSTTGNLAAREEAEAELAAAKEIERDAKRANRIATTGTGLRTVPVATITDEASALDWAYGRAPGRFRELVQQMADEAVRGGMRSIPGFSVEETKVAR